MPFSVSPRRAETLKLSASGAAKPFASAIWPRGIASVCRIRPVAGSQSQ